MAIGFFHSNSHWCVWVHVARVCNNILIWRCRYSSIVIPNELPDSVKNCVSGSSGLRVLLRTQKYDQKLCYQEELDEPNKVGYKFIMGRA